MSTTVGDVKPKLREFVTFRAPIKMRETLTRMANEERRTLSQLAMILIEEALEQRSRTRVKETVSA